MSRNFEFLEMRTLLSASVAASAGDVAVPAVALRAAPAVSAQQKGATDTKTEK